MKIGVLGAGSWGIALARLLANKMKDVTVWSALPSEIEMLRTKHEHVDKLKGVMLPESITYTTKIEEAVTGSDIIVMAVPSKFIRSTANSIAPYYQKRQIIVNVSKGIEEESLLTMSQVIEKEIPGAKVAVLSGPSHAEEVGRDIPTTIVAAAEERDVAETIQLLFMSDTFRVYTSSDVLGVEVGAALKNVVALAAGMADGLGYGDNTKAALITRGMAEISRLGLAMGGKAQTFYGLSGIGDLIVTCASMHSRNRRAGILIGKGVSYKEAMTEVGMVVEGVYSAKAAYKLGQKLGVEMPIVEQVNKILFEGKNAADAVSELMLRDRKIENSGDWK